MFSSGNYLVCITQTFTVYLFGSDYFLCLHNLLTADLVAGVRHFSGSTQYRHRIVLYNINQMRSHRIRRYLMYNVILHGQLSDRPNGPHIIRSICHAL